MSASTVRQRVLPSGRQYEIRNGDQAAVITEVGATLRRYIRAGRDVLDGFGEEEMCSVARGQPLLPWPNRLEDGRYDLNGTSYQLPLTEPEQHNAIHGLARWLRWDSVEQSASRVLMVTTVFPQPGYPFLLGLEIEYTLSESGLSVRTTGRNLGQDPLPFGAGQHPYITVGSTSIDEDLLQAPGGSRLLTDSRQNAHGERAGISGDYDFRGLRPIKGVKLDTAFTDLERDKEGLAWVELRRAEGSASVRLWLDRAYEYVMLFTGDAIPEVGRRRKSLGVEPMTCAPNAFRTKEGLQILRPAESFTARWGISN
jgi:aldose 1-epimerase